MHSNLTHKPWNFEIDTLAKNIFDNTNVDNIVANYYKKNTSYYDDDDKIKTLRKVSVIHRLVRNEILQNVHDGVSFLQLYDVANNAINKYMKINPDLNNQGWAFPLGINVNNVVCHDSCYPDDDRLLQKNDIVKIDLGLHIDGNIIDSAVTVIVDGDDDVNDFYDPLLTATRDATFTAIYMSGPDAYIKDISEAIKEIIESYELETGKEIKAVKGLGGHNITPYKLHGGKLILSVPHQIQNDMRMLEDEIYAIETFASTGYGQISQDSSYVCSHFMLNENIKVDRHFNKNPILKWANENNNRLPFTHFQIKDLDKYQKNLKEAVNNKQIVAYPPMIDNVDSHSSQLEHTIHVKNGGVEILSLGKDY